MTQRITSSVQGIDDLEHTLAIVTDGHDVAPSPQRRTDAFRHVTNNPRTCH